MSSHYYFWRKHGTSFRACCATMETLLGDPMCLFEPECLIVHTGAFWQDGLRIYFCPECGERLTLETQDGLSLCGED